MFDSYVYFVFIGQNWSNVERHKLCICGVKITSV